MGQFVTGNGFTGTIGGSITVYGTAERQTITVADVAGTVTFDPSFNKGGDTIVLAKSAAAYTIAQSGSTVVLTLGDQKVIIPVGTTANVIQFFDGDRALVYRDGLKIGDQIVTTIAATISTIGTTKSALAADASTNSARLILSGENATVGGNVSVYGSEGAEKVSVVGSGSVTFDPSFNKGGDTVSLSKFASNFSAQRSGSSVVLRDATTTISIPMGTVGLTADFNGERRTIIFSNGEFKVGTDVASSGNASKLSATPSAIPAANFLAPQQINGMTIERPYTVEAGVYRFAFNVEGFYFVNKVLSALPSYYDSNGPKTDVYTNEFAFALDGVVASKLTSVISTSSPVDSTEIADFNGDGYLDVFIGDSGYDAEPFPGGQNKLLFGSPNGFIDKTANLPTKIDYTHSAASGDIDKDGDIDIFVGNLAWKDSMKDPYFLINDGRGNFTEKYIFEAGFNARRYSSSILSDLDQDGAPELILGGDNIPSVIMKYIDGVFRLSQTLTGPDNRVKTDVLTGDLDRDGDIEILFSSTSYNPFYKGTKIDVYEQINGQFVLSQKYAPVEVSSTKWNGKFYLTDLNGDSYLDVVSTGMLSETKILMNDGSSLKFDTSFKAPWAENSIVEMWDLNGDGDLDFVYSMLGTGVPGSAQNLIFYVMFTA